MIHRCFSTRTFPDLPGLILKENYLAEYEQLLHQRVFAEAVKASELAQEMAAKSSRPAMESPAHNIPIRSEYVPVELELSGLFHQDSSSSSISNNNNLMSAENFSHYGDGHQLTYFRGNKNIPRLGLPLDFLDQLSRLNVIEQEVRESRQRLNQRRTTTTTSRGVGHGDEKMKWRLTLNYYPSSGNSNNKDTSRVGFPWHRDLEANGASTMILGLGSAGQLQFGKEPNVDISKSPPKDNRVKRPGLIEPMETVTLEPGSLLILTGAARWHYVHRVLPASSGDGGAGERASLVFGVW